MGSPARASVRLLQRTGSLMQLLPAALAWLLVLAWSALILALGGSRGLGAGLDLWLLWLGNCGHAAVYGLLGLWMALLLPRSSGWPVIDSFGVRHVLGAVLVVALADEVHQSFVGVRNGSALDVLTDLTGAACVLWIVAYLSWPTARDRGLWLRMAVAAGLCALAGTAATLVPLAPSLAWL